jgi:MraZ protein
MLLTGTYTRSIDDKLRLAIPKPLRDLLQPGEAETGLYVAPGTDGSLAIYTEDAFAKLAEKLANASPTGQDIRDFGRLFYARAQRVEFDRQGRVRIPMELAPLVGLPNASGGPTEVVLVGVRDHLELWDSQRWREYLAARQDRYDQIAERAFS